MGAIYSWSLFNQPLMDKFGWDKSAVVLTFSIAIFFFALSTLISGRLQDKKGPRLVATIGGLLYGTGLMLSSLATTLPMLYLTYGVLAGSGVGFAYVCPISTLAKWFPTKKGLITGVAVGAFGGGSLIFKSVIQSLIISVGVSSTFFYLGVIFMAMAVIGAQFLAVPEASATNQVKAVVTSTNDFSMRQMIKTKEFYLIFIMFLFGCMSGLLVIGLAKDIGVQLAGLSPVVAANAVSLIAFFNAGGRIILGGLSDKLGRIRVIFMMFTITAVSMLIMSMVTLNYFLFFACLAAIAFTYGGFLAIFPTLTGEFYGSKNVGANYGIVYQAYGIAALVGPIIVASLGGLKPTFMVAAILAIIGGAMTFMVKTPSLANVIKIESIV
jgi:OFA family oxalate/formate antiporter-like MFS transporter